MLKPVVQYERMITAVILTKNSRRTLSQALRSVSFCSEVLVIDDDSKDETKRIARATKARVIQRTFTGSFADQRNFALEKARYPWVLFIDSDEVVPKALAQEVTNACVRGIHDGYYLRRQDYFYGKPLRYGETSSVRLLRLARKDTGKWKHPVHEVWDINGTVGDLHSPLQHYPHASVAEFLTKVNRYSTIRAHALFDQSAAFRWYDVVLYPLAKFVNNYLFLQGFRDGMRGAIYAWMMSFHSFLVRAKLWHRMQTNNRIKTP